MHVSFDLFHEARYLPLDIHRMGLSNGIGNSFFKWL